MSKKWIDIESLEFEKRYRSEAEKFWWNNFSFDFDRNRKLNPNECIKNSLNLKREK